MGQIHVPYKVFPGEPGEVDYWLPFVNVSIIHRNVESKKVEAIVDSGSPQCLFEATFGAALGIKIKAGQERKFLGAIDDSVMTVYFHPIKLKGSSWNG